MSYTFSKYIRSSARGFTLVELIVAVGIFTSVITIATGALFSAQAVNAKLEQTRVILDGVNLAAEIMSRDIRYGSNFHCTNNKSDPTYLLRKSCAHPTGNSVLLFKPSIALPGSTDSLQDRIAYYLVDGVLYRDEMPYGALVRTSQVTSIDADVEDLTFFVVGANSSSGNSDDGSLSDYDQPLITFTLSGVTVPTRAITQPVRFSVQTSVSSRGLDN